LVQHPTGQQGGVDVLSDSTQGRKIDPYSSGTIIFPDGTYQHLSKKEFQVEVLDRWKSSKSGALYPSKWRVKVPSHQIELTLSPTVKDQELITKESTRVTYWEGSVKVEGNIRAIQSMDWVCGVDGICKTFFQKNLMRSY